MTVLLKNKTPSPDGSGILFSAFFKQEKDLTDSWIKLQKIIIIKNPLN